MKHILNYNESNSDYILKEQLGQTEPVDNDDIDRILDIFQMYMSDYKFTQIDLDDVIAVDDYIEKEYLNTNNSLIYGFECDRYSNRLIKILIKYKSDGKLLINKMMKLKHRLSKFGYVSTGYPLKLGKYKSYNLSVFKPKSKTHNESRVPNPKAFKFKVEEANLFEDLLLEYVDKYNMKKMPMNDDESYFFDASLPHIQYLVQRLGNIGIDIESANIPLDEVFEDIKNNFVRRVEKWGYHVFHCKYERPVSIINPNTFESQTKYSISITIMQND